MRNSNPIRFMVIVSWLYSYMGMSQGSQNPPVHSFYDLNWEEIKPSAIQYEAMAADNPRGRPFFDEVEKVLWVTGSSHIWKWSLSDGFVARLTMPSGRRGILRIISADAQSVWAMDAQQVWELKLNKGLWQKYDGSIGPACNAEEVMPAVVTADQVYFSTNCGIFMLHKRTEQLIRATGEGYSASDLVVSGAAMGTNARSLVVATEQKVIEMAIDGHRLNLDKKYDAKSKILGVKASGSHYWAWTAQAILVFDQKWNRRQVIPTTGKRKILSFNPGSQFHVVGFADGHIEIMDIKSRKKWASSTRNYLAQSIFLSQDEAVAVLSCVNELPRVFALRNLR